MCLLNENDLRESGISVEVYRIYCGRKDPWTWTWTWTCKGKKMSEKQMCLVAYRESYKMMFVRLQYRSYNSFNINNIMYYVPYGIPLITLITLIVITNFKYHYQLHNRLTLAR
jgi:hypothetical protein